MDPEQIEELLAAFEPVKAMLEQLREQYPKDAAQEQEEGIDETTNEEEEYGQTDEALAPANDKQLKKNAAVAMLKRSL